MFREALSYPTRKPKGPRSVLLGGSVIFLVSLFGLSSLLEGTLSYVALLGIVPWLFLRGYYVRVVRTTIGRDRPTPPPFDEPKRLFRDGGFSLLISVCYLLPGAVVVGPLVVARALGTDAGSVYGQIGLPTALANAALSVTGFLAIVAAMYLIGALYALPVAVARFAYHDRVRSAFAVRQVASTALTEDYAVAWAVSLLLQVLLFPFAYAFRAVLVGFFLHFVVAAGARYCYGQGVGDALGLEPVVPDPAANERAATAGDRYTPAERSHGDDPVGESRGGTEGERT